MNPRFRSSLSLLAGGLLLVALPARVGVAQVPDEAPLYKDAAQPVEARTQDLLARMTEEKVAQLLSLWQDKGQLYDENGQLDPAKAPAVIPHGIGTIARPTDRIRTGAGSPAKMPTRGPEAFAFFNRAVERVVEPGEFEIIVGPSSAETQSITLEITDPAAGSR